MNPSKVHLSEHIINVYVVEIHYIFVNFKPVQTVNKGITQDLKTCYHLRIGGDRNDTIYTCYHLYIKACWYTQVPTNLTTTV